MSQVPSHHTILPKIGERINASCAIVPDDVIADLLIVSAVAFSLVVCRAGVVGECPHCRAFGKPWWTAYEQLDDKPAAHVMDTLHSANILAPYPLFWAPTPNREA